MTDSHWNYRLIKEFYTYPDGKVEEFITLNEVYYENNKPVSWTEAKICGESVNELKEVLIRINSAFEKELLIRNGNILIEEHLISIS